MRALRVLELGDGGGAKGDGAFVGDEDAGEAVEEGGFAGARRAHDRDSFARPDVDVHAGECVDGAESLDDVSGGDQWCVHVFNSIVEALFAEWRRVPSSR